jgi:hypothetical protein
VTNLSTAVSTPGDGFVSSREQRFREKIDRLIDQLAVERRQHARTRMYLAGARTEVRSLKQQIAWMEKKKR